MSLTRLERLAFEVAILAPIKRSKYSIQTTIDWRVIEELREEFASRGFDWKAARKRMERLVEERRKAEKAERAKQ